MGSPIPGPEPRPPGALLGGAEAWPLAALGSGSLCLLAGPRGLAQPGLPPGSWAGRTLGFQPPGSPPLPAASSLQVVGQGSAEPPRRANSSWGAWACSQDLLCLLLLQRNGEKTGEKFPEQSWPHISFSQVRIEHLLDAWPLDLGCGQGLGRNVSLRGPQEFPQETMPEKAVAQDQVIERKEKPGSSPLPSLFLPLLFLPPGCVSLAPPLLINSSHTSLLSLAFHWRVPSPSEEQMLSPIVSPPVTAASQGQDLPRFTPPPSPPASAFRDWSPKATAPHPTLNQLLVLSDDSSHSEHDLFLTGSEKTVAWDFALARRTPRFLCQCTEYTEHPLLCPLDGGTQEATFLSYSLLHAPKL